MTKDDFPLPLRNYITIDRAGDASFGYGYASGAAIAVIKIALTKLRDAGAQRRRAQILMLREIETLLADEIAEQELARRQWDEALQARLAALRAARLAGPSAEAPKP